MKKKANAEIAEIAEIAESLDAGGLRSRPLLAAGNTRRRKTPDSDGSFVRACFLPRTPLRGAASSESLRELCGLCGCSSVAAHARPIC